MRAPSRLRYLGPSVRSSTATMSSMPIALSPWTRLLPIMPAAPVTTIFMLCAPRRCAPALNAGRRIGGGAASSEQLLVGDARGAELAHHDAAGAVGDRHRLAQAQAAGEHGRERR